MCLKLKLREKNLLKQELHTMLVLKYGMISLMMKRQMYGPSDVHCTKWPLFVLPSFHLICSLFSMKWQGLNKSQFLNFILINWVQSSTDVFKRIQKIVPQLHNFNKIGLLKCIKISVLMLLPKINLRRKNYNSWIQSISLQTDK